LTTRRHVGIGVSYVRGRMHADPVRTRELVGEVVDAALVVALEMLMAARDRMSDLVVSGYGVDPDGFYAEVVRLVDLRLRSIGYLGAEGPA
jgi:hypothetical protein